MWLRPGQFRIAGAQMSLATLAIPPRAYEAVKRYVQIAKDNGIDLAQMALAFVISRDFVTSTIIGATTMEQLKTDIDSAVIKLTNKVLSEI